MYFTVPYLGKPSVKFQRRIQRNFTNHDLNIRSAYNTTKVGSYFSLKSKISPLFTANVVYQYTCSLDKDIFYIGETRRQLCQRISDHRRGKTQSAVFDHVYTCNHCQNVDNFANLFSILHRCSPTNITSVEALMIYKRRPKLNIQMGPGRGTAVSLKLYR